MTGRAVIRSADLCAVAVKRWMIDATRDEDGDANYPAAFMLAQVTFWCDPDSKSGRPRSDHQHGEHLWLVRADDEWEAELGMSRKVARKARLRLVALGFIAVVTLVDDGVRCTHIRRLYPDDSVVDKPSTIVPEREHLDSRPSSGSGTEHVPDQALTHAGASLPSLETKEETVERTPKKRPLAETNPLLDRAFKLVDQFWKYCHDNDIPRPTIAGGKDKTFPALAKMVRQFIEDGWEEEEIMQGLIRTRVYTLAGISYTLREARERSKPAGPNPHLVRY